MPTYKIKKQPKTDESKKPDEFLTLMEKITHIASQNRGVIIGLILILFIAGISYFGLTYYQDKKIITFNEKVANLDPSQENYYVELGKIIDEYQNLKVAQLMKLEIIQHHIEEKKFAEALAMIDELQSKNLSMIDTSLSFMKANLLWETDQLDQALKVLDSIQSKDDNHIELEAKYLSSLILEDKNNLEEAKKNYQEILSDTNISHELKSRVIARLVILDQN